MRAIVTLVAIWLVATQAGWADEIYQVEPSGKEALIASNTIVDTYNPRKTSDGWETISHWTVINGKIWNPGRTNRTGRTYRIVKSPLADRKKLVDSLMMQGRLAEITMHSGNVVSLHYPVFSWVDKAGQGYVWNLGGLVFSGGYYERQNIEIVADGEVMQVGFASIRSIEVSSENWLIRVTGRPSIQGILRPAVSKKTGTKFRRAIQGVSVTPEQDIKKATVYLRHIQKVNFR